MSMLHVRMLHRGVCVQLICRKTE